MSYQPNDDFRPFSNHTEYEIWLHNNCQRGERGCRRYNPEASTSRHGCPMEVAMALGSATSGHMKAKLALRCGLLVPGEKGELVRPDEWIRCPEYKGYDEPDDRRRRGPKPPEGQQDLLDPRNAPEPTPVAKAGAA